MVVDTFIDLVLIDGFTPFLVVSLASKTLIKPISGGSSSQTSIDPIHHVFVGLALGSSIGLCWIQFLGKMLSKGERGLDHS